LGRIVALKGDFARFHRHVLRVESLGQPDALRSLTDNLAEEAIDLVLDGMSRETDPYGQRHAPKVFGDGRAVLTGQSSSLKRGWHRVRSDGKGFRIAPSVAYAKYHQLGTGIYGPKKHRIVPKNGQFLAFTVEGYVTKSAYLGAKAAWASSITPGTSVRDAKSSFKRNVSGLRSSRIFVRSVKGCRKRMMVPRKNDIPPQWKDAFVGTCNDWFAKKFKAT
jgi:hypothetical protein